LFKIRKTIRLKDYDYSSAGYYYITICTKDRKCILGKAENDSITVSKLGEIITKNWNALVSMYKHIELNQYVVMPNHIHAIIVLNENCTKTIGDIICGYKSKTAREYNKINKLNGEAIWQRGYYEHIIRNEKELYRIQKYILENPIKWKYDRLYIS
jgi:REP element-mobilizing transposase RayT